MKRITATLTLLALLSCALGSYAPNAQGKDHQADVVIYGPTSAAIAAAVRLLVVTHRPGAIMSTTALGCLNAQDARK